MTAPTRLVGRAVEAWDLAGLGDVLEHVPELLPGREAAEVYHRMAKDGTIAAVLAGYGLNLRRAQWQIDGTECRPEVVQHVADDLGLPVAGEDRPTAARVRGVSWHQHLRSALGMLTYGFSCAELLAEVGDDGKAHLVALADRMPWSIDQIHVDPKTGALLGVSQDAMAKADRPQIAAARIALYVHEQEGANFWGTPLIRPSYPAWWTKIEMMRVHSTANSRFGMGVPVMEALPGTQPGVAEMREAMELAAAARAGNQAGAASPPGFTFKLIGLSGSVPATLDYIEWLDRQIVKSALMGHLDLGQGGNGGSRALADSFIDSWTLALSTLGELVCDVATRQIAARIVGWNWGESENVPKITVAGIGTRRDVTAESLQILSAAGLLDASPELKAYVAREWRLPKPDPTAPVVAPGADLPKPTTSDEPAEVKAAARPRSRRKRTPSQPALFGDDEADAGRIQAQWDTAKARLLKRWPKVAAPLVEELTEQTRSAVEVGDLALLGQLQASAGVVAALAVPLAASGTELAAEAAAGVVEEAAAQDVTIGAPDEPGADRVRQHADAVARIIATGYASGAARTALQLAGAGPQEVRDEVERHLTELGTTTNGLVGTEIGGLLSAAQHAGRLAVMEQHPADKYLAVEVNDTRQCPACREISGTEFETLRKAIAAYPSAGYAACAGRHQSRCRGFLRPMWT